MERQNIKNIERRIKEIAKDYESRGFLVIISPKQSELPSFLKGYEPDIIAKKNQESVVIEVKTKSNISELKKFEKLADSISKQKNWRFELVFTNPLEQTIDNGFINQLSVEKQKERITEITNLLNLKYFDAAFLLGWATLESSMRFKLTSVKTEVSNKSTLSIIKTIYSLGHINQHDYRNLEKLYNQRNHIIHGFESIITFTDVIQLLNIILFLRGDSIENKMYDWLENLDLDYYEDIYSLYSTIKYKDNYGAFSIKGNNNLEIFNDFNDEVLKLKGENERLRFIELIEQEYMDDMDPEGWYGFHRAMEKDD